jgi:hypothetical protein
LKNFLEKTGNRFMFTGEGYEDVPAGTEQQDILLSTVNSHSVIDLSAHLSKEGVLQWDAPPGNWTIFRFGYTITGATNKAAPERGIGLECDKFSREAIDFHFEQMLRHLPPLFLELAIKGKAGFEIDSYEAGPQTWTKAFPDEFHSRRGYAIQNYLPALTGRIINSISYTEQFLWDVRKTQADLMADYYYGRFAELCHSKGLKSFVEPYDKGPFEEMQAGSKADVAMGEFWYGLHSLLQGNLSVQRTSKLAASIISTNGRMVVGAESFTSEPESSRWQEYPFTLKVLGDKMFCEGINNMIIHRFAHQPNTHVQPGMTMGPWGIHFDRTNTWFHQANGWLQYTARCQAMLQQGLPVRDLLYFTGEEGNVYTRVSRKDLVPAPPVEYDYDLINADTILQKLRISNGTIVLSHGMRYKVLVLQDFRGITLKLLQKLQQLVHEGMILVGKKPSRLLGLEAVQKDQEFERITGDLWGPSSDSGFVLKEVGKGHVIWGDSLKAILQRFHIEPDVVFSSALGNAPVLFTHRIEAGTDMYFITNQRRSFETIQGSFRVKNKQPEIWDPVTGKMIVASLYQSTIDRTFLPLHLPPYGSLFIVFRSPATSQGLLSVTRHAKQVLSTTPFTPAQNQLFRGIANNFTVVLWAKPEMNIMTRTSVHMGTFKHPYTDYYAVYPSPGEKRYGPGHATCGLAIGRNGVSIWESRTYPVLALVAEVPISGWSHIALVYQDGVPSVFVNGQMIRKGTKSSANVHPGLGEDHIEEGVSSYNGDMGKPEVFSGHLSVQQLQHLASLGPPSLPLPPLVEVANERGKPALLFWQNGTYHAKKRSGRAVRFDIQNISKPVEIKGPWQISFPPLAGAPPAISLDHLVSLHRVENSGVKYFSGTATYKTNFSISADFLQRKLQVFVDLGRVEVVAQVMINGKDLGTFWIRPYRANVTQAIRIGLNNLEIRVTNLWPNRLIGDEQMPDPDTFSLAGSNGFEHLAGDDFGKLVGYPIEQLPDWYVSGKSKPENGRVCFTTWKHYRRNDPLLESGLIGPVRLTAAILRTI